MTLEIVYEATGYNIQLNHLIGIFISLIGIILVLNRKKNDNSLAAGIFCLIIGIIVSVFLIGQYNEYYNNVWLEYKNGEYEVVEGYLDDISDLDESPNGIDRIVVDNKLFEIGFNQYPGLQQKAYLGGPINSFDIYYKIYYIKYNGSNYIMKVEIRDSEI